MTHDSIWTEENLRKEQIRATLASSAIALSYYLKQAFESTLEVLVPDLLRIILPDRLDVTNSVVTFFWHLRASGCCLND